MSDAELLQLLGRMFPSFRGVPADEAARRAEALGLFAARAWAAGPQAMLARGIEIPPAVHTGLASVAPRVVQAGRGGLTFLTHVRRGFEDDPRFAQALTGIARVYAETIRGGPVTAAALPTAAPQAAPGAPAQPRPRAAPRDLPGSGEPLDLLPDDAPPPPRYAPPAPASTAPPGRPPAGDDGTDESSDELALELAPSGGEAARPSVAELLYEGGAALDVRPTAYGDVTSDLGGGGLPADETAPPEDPAERAFWSYERSGDERFLAAAEQALQGELRRAPHATAAAAAEASLGKVALLRGDAAGAERLAMAALARDPSNLYAVEVLVRVSRGEADAATFDRDLIALAAAIDRGDAARLRQLAQAACQRHPGEPLPALALGHAGRLMGDEELFGSCLRAAWACYPSARFAQKALGGFADAVLAESLIQWGRRPFQDMDPDELRWTVQDIDSKENLIAGSLRMGVGLSRVALARPNLARAAQRRLWIAAGRGLMGLQYFEAAQPVMGKALMLGPSEDDAKLVQKERLQCQSLWRAFDRPGIKAQQKKYHCLGSHGMAETLRARLDGVRKDRQARQSEVYSKGGVLAERARQDPALREEVSSVAEASSVQDPLAPIDAIDRELDAIARERAGAAAGKPEGKGGLFGKIKAAASQVSTAAKDAALKLKESQLRARREDAVKRLAVVLARDLVDQEWRHPMLVAYAREAQRLEAFCDYLDAEEARVKDELNQLAELA